MWRDINKIIIIIIIIIIIMFSSHTATKLHSLLQYMYNQNAVRISMPV